MGFEGTKIQKIPSEPLPMRILEVKYIGVGTIVLREGIPYTVQRVARDSSGEFMIAFEGGDSARLSGDDSLECIEA